MSLPTRIPAAAGLVVAALSIVAPAAAQTEVKLAYALAVN